MTRYQALRNEAADHILAQEAEIERLNTEMAAGAHNMRWMMKSHNENHDRLTAERDQAFAQGFAQGAASQLSAEPVARFNWDVGDFEWLTKYEYKLHHMKPLFTLKEPK